MWRAVWVVVALGLPAVAQARSKLPKVMVLDFPEANGIDHNALKTLDEFLAGAVRDQGFDVITPGQMGAVLGLERQKQLLGCSDSSCLAELGGALGVDFIVMGSVAVLESNSALTLTAVNQKGIAVGSQRKLVSGRTVEGLVHAIEAMVPRLMTPARTGTSLPDLAAAPAAADPAGGLGVTAAPSTSHPTGAYVVASAGILLIASSVVVGLAARSSSSAYEGDVSRGVDASADASTTHTRALASTVLTGAGVAALAGGLAWWGFGASNSEVAP